MSKPRDNSAFNTPEIFLTLGIALAKQGKVAAVSELIGETIAANPGNRLYQHLSRLILGRNLPLYHDAMLLDKARNAAYRRAIELAVPGRVVLDIGTGSGLLAMIAARAGAARVIACEVNPVLADAARKIIAANGLQDRIEVHACHSTKLDRADIAPKGVDVVVSEIFSADLVGEGVLASLEHARTQLCAPGAQFIPAAATLKAALADFTLPDMLLGDVEGFDLSLFTDSFPLISMHTNDDTGLVLRSDSARLCEFAFLADAPIAIAGQSNATVMATGGKAAGIAQWLEIDFGDGVIYQNTPGSDALAHWCTNCHPFGQPTDFVNGEVTNLNAFYHGENLAIWHD